MAQEKCKLGAEDLKLSKNTSQKYTCSVILSKHHIIIRTLSLSVVCLSITPW